VRRWVEHTSEVQLDIASPTEAGVFAEALGGLAELLGGDDASGPATTAPLRVRAGDRAALLVGWLEELLWVAERDQAVPGSARALVLDGDELRAEVDWRPAPPRPLVKAVTWHDLRFERADDGYHARVVLDV